MPATISHALSMTTPDDPAYENKPSNWNQTHAVTFLAAGSEISGAFSNGNGLSFGLSAGQVTGSYTVPSTAGLLSNIRISGGTTSNLLSAVTFGDANGISFGLNGSTLTASHNGLTSQSNQAASGSNGSFTFQTLSFSNANGMSFGTSAGPAVIASYTVPTVTDYFSKTNTTFNGANISGSITNNTNGLQISLSVAPGGGGADGVNALVVNGGASTASTTLALSNANNVTFGLNAGTITASASFNQTNQSAIKGFGVSNTGQTAGNTGISTGIDWVLAGSQSITMSQSTAAGGPNTIWVQHPAWLTTARASNDAIGLNTALTAGPLAWTVNSSGLSLNAGSAAGTTSGFAGNLISGSMTHNTAGLNVSLNHPAWLTTARGSTDAIGLNTAQTNVTWTVNSSGLSLNAAGYAGTGTSATNASITLNSNGLAISVGAGGGVTPVASASNGSFSFTTLGFSNANNVTFGTSAGSIITASVAAPGAAAENNWVNLLGANTAGNTTASGSTIGYSGINLTMSGTNGSVVNISAPATSSLVGTQGVSISTNGSTISVIGPNPASYFQNLPLMWSAIVTTSAAQSTSIVIPLMMQEPISVNRMRFVRSVVGGATSVATVANTSWGFTQSQTHNYVWLSYGTGASSNSLQMFTSTSYGVTMSIQGSNGAASNNLSVNRTINAPMSTGNSAFTFSTAPAGSASVPFATTDMSNFISGLRLHDSNFAASFPSDLFFLVHGVSTNGATGGGTAASALTACTVNFQLLGYPCITNNLASFGTSAQSFNAALVGGAMNFSTAGGGTTGSIDSISKFTSVASNPVWYMYMDRIA